MARQRKQRTVETEPFIWLKDGRFHFTIDKILPGGKRWRKTGSSTSLDTACEKRDAALALWESGSTAKTYTIKEWGEECVAVIWPSKINPKTIEQYESDLRNHVHPILGTKPLAAVTSTDIERLLGDMEADSQSKHLRANVRNVISKLYTTAAARVPAVYSGPNPCKGITVNRTNAEVDENGDELTHKRTLSDEEQSKLLAAAKAHPDPRLYGMVLVGLRMGLRRGEILAFEFNQINTEHSMYRVRWQLSKVTKTEREKLAKAGKPSPRLDLRPPKGSKPNKPPKTRLVPIPKDVMDWMEERKAAVGKFAFQDEKGNWLPPETALHMFDTVAEKAGLIGQKDRFGRPLPKPGWHDLRHTFGHWAAKQGWNRHTHMKVMGHANIATSDLFYTDVDYDEIAKAIERAEQVA